MINPYDNQCRLSPNIFSCLVNVLHSEKFTFNLIASKKQTVQFKKNTEKLLVKWTISKICIYPLIPSKRFPNGSCRLW